MNPWFKKLSKLSPNVDKLREAIKLFLNDKNGENKSYRIAKAALFLGNIQLSERHLNNVRDTYRKGYGIGKAKILKGALELISANETADQNLKTTHLQKAEANFKIGVGMDENFWIDIFVNKKPFPKDPYLEISKIYGSRAMGWIDELLTK